MTFVSNIQQKEMAQKRPVVFSCTMLQVCFFHPKPIEIASLQKPNRVPSQSVVQGLKLPTLTAVGAAQALGRHEGREARLRN